MSGNGGGSLRLLNGIDGGSACGATIRYKYYL
jgi:hypothetical protein